MQGNTFVATKNLNMINLKLAKKIKELRAKKGLTQEELANKTDLSLRTIQRIEGCETEPRGDTLKRLANALDVTPNDLIEWTAHEDRDYLAFFNLSALSFLAFPLLGIIVPLALWMVKRDKIKGLNENAKKLINFQITWCIFVFLWCLLIVLIMVFGIQLPRISSGRRWLGMQEMFLLFTMVPIGAIYLYNKILVIINGIRSYKQKSVFYKPAIRFLK
jgi:uncharacterized Tic20 family protein